MWATAASARGRAARAGAAALLAALFVVVLPAAAQDAPDFTLDLDTGGHRATVKALAFSPDGEMLVSASDDKTIRVWDWRAGVTIRTIRGQIGPGHEGKVFAVAVSPDGGTVAAGGFFGPGFGETPPYGDIRLFDLKSGRMTGLLEGHEFAVYAVAFSPDGAWLAAGGQDGYAYVWRRDAAAPAGWTPHSRLDGDSWHIARLAFAADGTRLVAATADNGIRLWDMQSEREIALPAAADALRDTSVRALAVSPDGSLFATGNRDGLVQVWRAADGALVEEKPALGFLVGALSFTPDGTRLAASCGYPCIAEEGTVVWRLGEAEPALSYRGHDDTVFAGAAGPEGALVATAGGERNAIHVWDAASGERQALLVGAGRPVTAVGVAPDGTAVAWGHDDPCPREAACPTTLGRLDHHLPLPTAERSFEDPAPMAPAHGPMRRAVFEAGALSLAAAPGGAEDLANAVLQIRRDGETVAAIENDATTGYLHGAFTLLAGGDALVTGGNDGTMIAYSTRDGRFAGEFLDGHTGELHGMAEAPGAALLVTGADDQTLRLWNLETRALIASMFFAGEEWIIWTPQGYFNSSPNGDSFVGWHVNQGRDSAARFITARQLKTYLHSPEIVRRAIITGDAAGAARELRGTDRQLATLLQRRPPEFSVRLAEDVPAADGYVAVEITGAAEAGADVESFAVLANDRRIAQVATRSLGGADGGRIVIEVPVEAGENEIRITGYNAFGYLTERSVKALAKAKGPTEAAGTLYVVAVGVEQYPFLPSDCNGRSCDLAFPVDDAAEFMRVVAERTAPLFDGMEARVLVNRAALEAEPERARALEAIVGADNILEPDADTVSDAIEDFMDLPEPQDTTIVFVAGHGINIDEDYYFIPTDGRKAEPDRWRRSSLVDWRDMQRALERARGRRMMLLDTCHAANAFNPRLEKEAADARIVVLSATAPNNVAEERAELGHGVFTYAVLDGMRGAAASRDGVRILGLADHIDRTVRELTADRQAPFYHLSQTENFLLARP
ncbi:caspase family protein [Aquibium sp. A9E412]|uniref:caspase family protein n=1 Tax=Aquibium sp. A9E412 TaxID=2976767 RepID=UPI0025B1900A|nr:caspase family protein [Aquibium sp. A9E412]MDN2565925.1 caspase family protein [Aquibium sp. A9E412]